MLAKKLKDVQEGRSKGKKRKVRLAPLPHPPVVHALLFSLCTHARIPSTQDMGDPALDVAGDTPGGGGTTAAHGAARILKVLQRGDGAAAAHGAMGAAPQGTAHDGGALDVR